MPHYPTSTFFENRHPESVGKHDPHQYRGWQVCRHNTLHQVNLNSSYYHGCGFGRGHDRVRGYVHDRDRDCGHDHDRGYVHVHGHVRVRGYGCV
jgi:hypothetical protein